MCVCVLCCVGYNTQEGIIEKKRRKLNVMGDVFLDWFSSKKVKWWYYWYASLSLSLVGRGCREDENARRKKFVHTIEVPSSSFLSFFILKITIIKSAGLLKNLTTLFHTKWLCVRACLSLCACMKKEESYFQPIFILFFF